MSNTWVRGTLFFLILCVARCTPSDEPMDDSDLIKFATDYAAAWSGQDAESYALYFAKDGALKINDGEPAVGREAVAAVAQSFMTALPDMLVIMDSVDVVDGTPQFHWTLIATNSGPDGNGNRIHISGYEEWTFNEDGLILMSQGHMDSEEYQRQIEHGVPED